MPVDNGLGEQEVRSERRMSEIHHPFVGDDMADYAATPVVRAGRAGEQWKDDIRTKVLSGAYHSLAVAEHVARAILRESAQSAMGHQR